MARRAHYGSGTVTERSPGVWQLRLSLGSDPLTGKHLRATKTVRAANRKEALGELGKFQGEQHGSKMGATLASLLDEYLDARVDMSPSTRADFAGYIERYIPETMAKKRLRDVTARDLDRLYLDLLRRPLSAATVRRVHVILHAALEQAVRWGYITANEADRTRPPKVQHQEVTLPAAGDLVKLLAAVAKLELDPPARGGSPLPDFLALQLATGARPGELCALPWGDVDLAVGRVNLDQSVARGKGGAVVKATKTGKGRRVHVPAAVTEVLRARYARWADVIESSGVPADAFPVFPSKERGERPWRPDSMSREFRAVRDGLGLGADLTLRNLRHYCVSVLANEGVDVVTVAKRHGHSPQIMLSVYAHLFEEGDQLAADVLGAHQAALLTSR